MFAFVSHSNEIPDARYGHGSENIKYWWNCKRNSVAFPTFLAVPIGVTTINWLLCLLDLSLFLFFFPAMTTYTYYINKSNYKHSIRINVSLTNFIQSRSKNVCKDRSTVFKYLHVNQTFIQRLSERANVFICVPESMWKYLILVCSAW